MPNECCPPLDSACSYMFGGVGQGDAQTPPVGVSLAVSAYGSAKATLPMTIPGTGLLGLANIYPSVLVVDLSQPAWTQQAVNLKTLPMAAGQLPLPPIPVPDMSSGLLAEGSIAVQPRPGTMPGLYILQEGNVFYQYGEPLESGANPQSTAIYQEVVPPVLPHTFLPPAYQLYRNQLSGAELAYYPGAPAFVEVRHHDGTVARFDSFNPYQSPNPARTLWRLTNLRDPYDNEANFNYSGLHHLTSIVFPSGLRRTFDYSPGWRTGFAPGHDCIEIRHDIVAVPGLSPPPIQPAEVLARTWGLVFEGALGTSGGQYFGRRLFRTYSAVQSMLEDQAAAGPYTLGPASEIQGQVVHEVSYDDVNTSWVALAHRLHTGAPFAATLVGPANSDMPIQSLTFGADQRVQSHSTAPLQRTLGFTYPVPLRTADLLPGTLLSDLGAIAVTGYIATSPTTSVPGTVRCFEFDRRAGRIYTVRTTPSDTFLGRPRAANATTEDAAIQRPSGVPAAEPEWIETYNIYTPGCVCQKPSERRLRSRLNGLVSERSSFFEYHPINKLVTQYREPNPESNPTGPEVTWTYVYEQSTTGTQDWGAWRIKTEVTPDGTFDYTYEHLLDRKQAQRHGQIPGSIVRKISGVRLQTSLTTTGSTNVQQTVRLNLSNSPGGIAHQGILAGQTRLTIDGDGIATVFGYSNRGFLLSVTEADRRLELVPNALDETTATTTNATSSEPVVTQYTLMLGTGEARSAVSTANTTVPRETRWFYDRFGNVKVVRELNRDHQNSPVSRYGGPATGRDWVETQYHNDLHRLKAVYRDRKPLHEAAGGAQQFLVTRYEYLGDGRLAQVFHPNGSYTKFDYDGFGTLYRSLRFGPADPNPVRSPKSFVDPFLEVVGSYQFDGSSHLWTALTRNAAGAVVEVKEPATQAPVGYTASTGGARHVYELDKLGRVRKTESYGGTTVLARRRFDYDQLDRMMRQGDDVIGFGSGEQVTAWQYASTKETQLLAVWRTGLGGGQAVRTQQYWPNGLLKQATDAAGNFVEYLYLTNSPFVTAVRRNDVDPIVGTRTTETSYTTNGYGEISQVQEGTWATLVAPGQAPSGQTIVHQYFYSSLGRVSRYLDPKAREQRFLTDALGRVVEHVRVGDGGDYIWNGSIYEDSGLPEGDGRTKTTRLDDRGEGTTTTHATITHRDFAGRPFILQNPGGTVAPTSSAKHQKMSLFAEYDGASRLKALYDGDFGRTDFFRDGPGRVILRRLANGPGSVDRISQYNTRDIIERDALGRIAGTEYWGTETGGFMYGEEEFQQDSVGRVHSERFRSVFAPQHWLINNSTYVGPNPYRSGLSYTDTLAGAPSSFEKANLSMTHDAIGRLAEIGWDRAPGAGGAMAVLAKYDYAGGMKRKREIRYGSSAAGPRSDSEFRYDRFDRLLRIADTVHPQTGAAYTGSQFDYEYDEVHNLTKERYTKVEGAVGDRFSYDPHHRLHTAKIGCNDVAMDDLTSGQAVVHEQLTYGLDGVNNRTSVTTQQGATTSTATYGLQGAAHPQGASNRYDSLSFSGTSSMTLFKYDDRGNLTYDGRFQYRYDYLNRLQEVWKVTPAVPVNDDAMYAEVESGAVDDAEDAVKLEVPDVHTRVFREHTNPAFRSRLRATIVGGVITVTPTPQGGGGRPGFLPNPAQLELVAVYVYDAFNRRVAAALVDPTLSDPAVPETQFHVWDGWRQVAQHRLDTATWQAPVMKQFVWGDGLDELVSYRRRVGPTGPWQTYFLLHGGQDTSAKLVDDAGVVVEQYEYDPYGRAKCFSKVSGVWTAFPESRVGLPFLWKGIRLDEITGLLQMRNRYYSVDLGRFLSVDPEGVWGDWANIGNEYCYGWARPLVVGDALGRQGQLSVIGFTSSNGQGYVHFSDGSTLPLPSSQGWEVQPNPSGSITPGSQHWSPTSTSTWFQQFVWFFAFLPNECWEVRIDIRGKNSGSSRPGAHPPVRPLPEGDDTGRGSGEAPLDPEKWAEDGDVGRRDDPGQGKPGSSSGYSSSGRSGAPSSKADAQERYKDSKGSRDPAGNYFSYQDRVTVPYVDGDSPVLEIEFRLVAINICTGEAIELDRKKISLPTGGTVGGGRLR